MISFIQLCEDRHCASAIRPSAAFSFLLTVCLLLLGTSVFAQQRSTDSDPLPGTKPLTMEGDIAFTLIDGVDHFLLTQWDLATQERHKHWEFIATDPRRQLLAMDEIRKELLQVVGAQENRIPFIDVQQVHLHSVTRCNVCDVYAISWPVVRDVRGEGLLLIPAGKAAEEAKQALLSGKNIPLSGKLTIAIPDADQTPEALIGLVPGVEPQERFALQAAAEGSVVLVPTLIDRTMEKRNNRCTISNREFLYRPGFELGHHLLGYELQKIRAAIDWAGFVHGQAESPIEIAVTGHGEGGLLALWTAAIDKRVSRLDVSGYFGSHPRQWDEPIDRNVFNLWNIAGNAELACMALDVPPRTQINIIAVPGPDVELPGNGGGAPSHLQSPTIAEVEQELEQLKKYRPQGWSLSKSRRVDQEIVQQLSPNYQPAESEQLHARIQSRALRQRDQIEQDTQRLLVESPYVRAEFMQGLDTSSLEKYQATVEPYREKFATEAIGRFELPLEKPSPRTRKAYDEKSWTGYEVVLDVFPDVIAYGLLLVPKDIKPGERRPVVVCQHGLEGRPQDVIGEAKFEAYSAFAAKLAERGYVTFAPQNLYLGKDRFRTLQRKANPLGKTLFSVIIPQHQQIANWLQTLPFVDGERMAFYGLSYGGKSAMRIPPLVPQFKAVICSADFNEWVGKNASTRLPYSYVWTGEYEIFEWNLGSTFNYAEMAALICPRPFMVERGHFDGVGSDEAVAYEFAKVKHLYSARLKIPDLCEMEVFDGPHKINGVGTFDFLDRHLQHQPPSQSK